MDPREYSLELSLDGNRFMDHQAAMTPPAAGRRRGGVGRRRSRPTAPDAADPVGLPSEEDIKNRIIVPHLQILGFANDDLKYETQFEITIGTKYRIPRGAKRSETVKAYSDIVCYRLEEPLFVVEVKRGDVELGDEEREQAISYARLLQPKMAPFAIVTNGRDTKVYDAVSGEEVTSLLESGWVKNKYRIAISEELRAEAARTLIGLSPDTVFDLCKAQHELHLGELVGGPNSVRAVALLRRLRHLGRREDIGPVLAHPGGTGAAARPVLRRARTDPQPGGDPRGRLRLADGARPDGRAGRLAARRPRPAPRNGVPGRRRRRGRAP